MADVRCPMCGKSNPAELEVCQFCQARLKPLRINPSQEEPLSSSEMNGEQNPSAADVPDWLNSLRQPQEEDTFSEQDLSEDELPDWLSQSSDSDEEDEAEGSSTGPDWLSGLRDRSSMEEDASGARADQTDIPWTSQEQPEEDNSLPDWLTSMRSGSDAELQEDIEPLEPASLAEEEPEWLSKIRSQSDDLDPDSSPPQTELPVPETGVESGDPFDLSDLESGIDDNGNGKSPSQVPAFDDLDFSDIPNWLTESEDQAFDPEIESEFGAAEWLSNPDEAFQSDEISEELDVSENRLSSTPEAEPAEEIPDWLAQFDQDSDQSLEQEGVDSIEDNPLPEASNIVDANQEVVRGLDEEEAVPPEELEPSFDLTAFEDEDLGWLDEIGDSESDEDVADTTVESEPVAPFTLDSELESEVESIPVGEVPDWLAEASPLKDIFGDEGLEETASEEETLEGEDQPDLAQADLPGWIEAMRPVEAATKDLPKVEEDSNLVESIGPLAGLKGVLPAEPDISQVKKPPAYLIKLQITDLQRANAALLEQMIKTEELPRAIPKRPVISSQHILRILIAFVLIFAVVWPLVMGGPQLQGPAFFPGAAATSQLITALNPDSTVLLAVDFEPGWSGEMDAVAAPVVDHLMLKGAFFALVSTTPSGPPQAEQLMNFVRQHEDAQLQGGLRYTNLGFIPGGPAGLLSFAQTPQQVLPVSQDGTHIWESGPLADVKDLADFGMVVVITENPQTARTWIEQVHPSMGDVPLVMLTSAQAEPLVRPYYDSAPQQVQGLVSGLAGGMAYENLTGRPGAASNYWNAFGLGLAVAAALIIVGGIFNAAFTLFARNKENVEGEK